MIDTRELRVGNIITSGKITRMDIGAIVHFIHTFKDGKCYTISNPLGELLSEDWLIRMGFIKHTVSVKSSTGKEKQVGVGFEFSALNVFLHKDGFFASVQKQRISEKPIQYVHQLQNLYFTLTGEELNWFTLDEVGESKSGASSVI